MLSINVKYTATNVNYFTVATYLKHNRLLIWRVVVKRATA